MRSCVLVGVTGAFSACAIGPQPEPPFSPESDGGMPLGVPGDVVAEEEPKQLLEAFFDPALAEVVAVEDGFQVTYANPVTAEADTASMAERTVVVLDAEGAEIASAVLTAEGTFVLTLPPSEADVTLTFELREGAETVAAQQVVLDVSEPALLTPEAGQPAAG